MAIGRSSRRLSNGIAGASMERALRALSPRNALQTLNDKSSPKGAATSSVDQKTKFGMKSSATTSSASTTHDNNRRGGEKVDVDGSEEAVKVAVRIRPLSNHNDQPQVVAGRAWKVSKGKQSVVEISKEKKSRSQGGGGGSSGEAEYEFDKVFGENTNTSEIYNELVSDIVDSVTNDGVNGTVFTYGQTSSGKTYTMRGADDSNDDSGNIGIIQMSAKEIFNSIQKEKSNKPNSDCSVRVSYTEIYNEELRDLLNDSKRKSSTSLTIREDKRGSITVEGLKEVAVSSLDELMTVFQIGEANKSVGSTKMNDRSSRSHAILQITLQKKTTLDADDDKENDAGIVVTTTSTLNLVDLAGSESVRHTGSSGMQKKEGGMINQSLLTLSKVLMSLGMKNPGHVNYRDSKLTRILKPSLSGNARMAVICCISPSDKYTDETKSTLQFATRAKLVKTNATSNEVVENESDVVAKLRLENVRAKMEIREKEKQLQEMADKLQQAESCGKRREADIPSSSVQAVCDDSTSLLELESKLTTANDLVASLERQVDELSSQKNDALDWIEELFSKVELKEKKIKEVLEETNSVTRQRDDLEDQLMNNTRHLEEASSRIEELQAVNEQASNEIQTMEAEIESFKKRVTSENQTAQKLEDLYSEVAKVKEDYEISQHTLRQVRADNEELRNDAENQISDLEDTLRLVRANNEELRIDSQEEINELMLKIESLKTLQSSQTSENEKLTNQVADLENTLRRERVDKEELRLDSERQINELVSEIGSLKTQQSSSTRDNDELGMQNVELTKQLRDFEHAAKKDAEEKGTMQQHIDRCEKELSLCEQELTSLKRSLHSTANEGLSERVQLHEKISSLERKNEDITTQMCQVEGVVTKYEGEKRELLSQIEQYEQELSRCEVELSRANLLLKSKSDEAESAAHNVESEMVKERDRVINGLRVELNQSVSSNKDLADQISHLQQDKERLESDRRRITSEMSICQRNAKDLTLKLVGAQRLLDERVSSAEQMESEKVELLASLDSANEKVRNLEAQCEQAEARLHLAEEENVSLKERDSELRGSITRIRELVDSMKRRNNELEGENDALRIRVEALEKDISTAFAERDAACEKRDILSSEMDAALEERESAKMKLNMLAAEFEADYETLRSKVDMLMTEKKGLEDQLAIVEAGKTSVECKSDRILQRDNALVGKHDLLKSEFNKQAKKVVDLQEQVKELSMALKRSHVEKDQLIAEKQTMRDTIKTMRTRLRSPRTGPSPRGQSNNKKASFFRSRQ